MTLPVVFKVLMSVALQLLSHLPGFTDRNQVVVPGVELQHEFTPPLDLVKLPRPVELARAPFVLVA